MTRFVGLTCALTAAWTAWTDDTAPPFRVYAHLLQPDEHPDYTRLHVQPPTWETFGNRTHFVTLRGFSMDGDTIVDYREELDKYTVAFGLGDVVWPSYPVLFADNVSDLAEELKRRGLFLFDIWGYVPGSGPGGYWQQYKPSPDVLAMLEAKLGDHWLGMDVGEQDGRYVGGYASQLYPISNDRVNQYLNFQHHFEAMCDELGNKMSTLVSLNFGHYLIKEGVYTTIGAETAQGLPNGQVYYAFIRGAGKQYGVPWFGNASVWNRWGYKTYAGEGDNHGPTKGTSLSLLKRLLYSHILYNCMFVGYESGWFGEDGLTPIGHMQQAAREWTEQYGTPGVMLTPVALMTDFFAGWTFPRHLYTNNVLRVWGNVPYEEGDYLTDGTLNFFYPRYQDSSFFHDETGFLSPTPFGDSVDCLLTDAPGWLLARYPLLIIAGELRGDEEIRDKLAAYAEQGGHLVITAGNLAKFEGGLGSVTASGPAVTVQAGTIRGLDGFETTDHTFALCPLAYPSNATVLQTCNSEMRKTFPTAVRVPCGKGRITVLASPFGIADAAAEGVIHNDIDRPFASPYPLLNHVRALIGDAAQEQCLFDTPDGLSLIVCRRGPGEYTLGLCNNGLTPKPYEIVSRCGEIRSVDALPLDQSEKDAIGYLPTGLDSTNVGISTDTVTAGGDIRIFRVKVQESIVEEMPYVTPPPRPRGRILPIGNCRSIQEEVLIRPTFFQHFDGVSVDWRYLQRQDKSALTREAGWITRQGLRVYVDMTSGINLYPDLRLVNNDESEYSESMTTIREVLDKMTVLGTRDAIVSLHRQPENNFTREQTTESFGETLRAICADALTRGITVYIRTSPKGGDRLQTIIETMDRAAAPNLRWAASTALLLHQHADPGHVAALVNNRPGLWLAAAPAYDAAGKAWTMNAPLAGNADEDAVASLLTAAPDAPILLDGVYANWDGEYRDARAIPENEEAM